MGKNLKGAPTFAEQDSPDRFRPINTNTNLTQKLLITYFYGVHE